MAKNIYSKAYCRQEELCGPYETVIDIDPALLPLPPDVDAWDGERFAAALRHEQHITSRINTLANLAVEEKDHATEIFLQWFVSEQVEEEESANRVLSQLKLAGESGGGLFMIDRELGQRVFTMPADLTLP